MEIWIRRVVKGLFGLGVVLFLGNMVGGGILPAVGAYNDPDSVYMRFVYDHTIIHAIAWLGSVGCGLCGLVSLVLTAAAQRLGHAVDVPRFYIWVPLLLCLVWFILFAITLGEGWS